MNDTKDTNNLPCYQCVANTRALAAIIGFPAAIFLVVTITNILNVIHGQSWWWDGYVIAVFCILPGFMFGALLSLPDIDEMRSMKLCDFHYSEVFKRG